jgi:hypothetical protein
MLEPILDQLGAWCQLIRVDSFHDERTAAA